VQGGGFGVLAFEFPDELRVRHAGRLV